MDPATTGKKFAQVWPLVVEQRDKLGDLLASLRDREWEADSLCAGWRVRDVVAHCIHFHLATPWNFFPEWIASGLSLNARNERGLAQRRSQTPAQLLTEYRATAGRKPIVRWEASGAIFEVVIHSYDIARPLGRGIDVSPKSLMIVADLCRSIRLPPIKRRSAGLTLKASDVTWSAGAGSEVTGPIASIILAITGRAVALDDLSGEGLDKLRSRL